MISVEEAKIRWRGVLDAGSTTVVDENNAAIFLEEVENIFRKDHDPLGKIPCMFIPCFRRLLSSLKLHYDPSLNVDSPYQISWSTELVNEMENMYNMDIDAEMLDVITQDIERHCMNIDKELNFNFEILVTEGKILVTEGKIHAVKIHAEPYEGES